MYSILRPLSAANKHLFTAHKEPFAGILRLGVSALKRGPMKRIAWVILGLASKEECAMTDTMIRWKWLSAMYVYTAAGAGLLGLAMLLAPNFVVAYLHMPIQDPVVFGVVGSAYLAFASASIRVG